MTAGVCNTCLLSGSECIIDAFRWKRRAVLKSIWIHNWSSWKRIIENFNYIHRPWKGCLVGSKSISDLRACSQHGDCEHFSLNCDEFQAGWMWSIGLRAYLSALCCHLWGEGRVQMRLRRPVFLKVRHEFLMHAKHTHTRWTRWKGKALTFNYKAEWSRGCNSLPVIHFIMKQWSSGWCVYYSPFSLSAFWRCFSFWDVFFFPWHKTLTWLQMFDLFWPLRDHKECIEKQDIWVFVY